MPTRKQFRIICPMNKKNIKTYLPFILLALSSLMIAAGFMREENYEVFTKAAHICLECIGIG